MRDLLRTALHWLWPQTCVHCREDLDKGHVSPLCLPCQRRLTFLEPPFCLRCSQPVPDSAIRCGRCARDPRGCAAIRAPFLYRGPAVPLVHAIKYSGRRSAARTAGQWMAAALARFPELREVDALVPVPLHPRRQRRRGYNQARLLCEGLSSRSGIPVRESLGRRRDTKAQWSLSREERLRNLEGAFELRDDPRGLRLLLVDDVCTSTTSLDACAQALKGGGAAWVGGYALAREPLDGETPIS